jgi:hypothetical protein
MVATSRRLASTREIPECWPEAAQLRKAVDDGERLDGKVAIS